MDKNDNELLKLVPFLEKLVEMVSSLLTDMFVKYIDPTHVVLVIEQCALDHSWNCEY